jgi:hypothetical protein
MNKFAITVASSASHHRLFTRSQRRLSRTASREAAASSALSDRPAYSLSRSGVGSTGLPAWNRTPHGGSIARCDEPRRSRSTQRSLQGYVAGWSSTRRDDPAKPVPEAGIGA